MATYTILFECRRLFAQHQLTGGPREPGIAQWLLRHMRNLCIGADNIQHGLPHSLEQIGLTSAIAIDLASQVDLLRTLVQFKVYLQVIRIARLGPLHTGKGHELVRCARGATHVGSATCNLQHSRVQSAECTHDNLKSENRKGIYICSSVKVLSATRTNQIWHFNQSYMA